MHNEPKHGIGCFFCGKPDKDKVHDPKEFYKPCPACYALMQQGVTLYGFTHEAKSHIPPIASNNKKENLYPTGQFIVLAESVPEKLLPEGMYEPIIKAGSAFLPQEIIAQMRALAGLTGDYSLITLESIDPANKKHQPKESEV